MDRQIKKNFWTWQKIVIILGVAALATFLGMAIYRDAGKSRLNVETERLLTDTVNMDVFKEYIAIFGTVEPLTTVYIDAVETGRIEEIFLLNGAMVQQGEEILRLSNLDLQLNVLNQEAQIVNQVNAISQTRVLTEQQSLNLKELALNVGFQIDRMEKRFKRNKSLYNDSVIAQVDYEETEDEYEYLVNRKKLMDVSIQKDSVFAVLQENQMVTTLDLMQRNLAFARTSLDNLIVKAPIAGQVSSLNSEVGQLITRGQRIAQIDNLDNFKIRARIDEFYNARIFPEQEASFTMNGKDYFLKVNRIYPEVVNGAFEADLVFVGDRPNNIKRGQSISLKLSLSDESRAMLLARGGFYQTTGGNWVYVIDPATGIARKRNIKVNRQNPNFYEVVEGLEVGDIVIVSSYENYGDKDELVLK